MDLLRAINDIVILDMSDVTSYSDIEHIRKFTVAIGWEPEEEGMATRIPISTIFLTKLRLQSCAKECKGVYCADLGEIFQMSIYYLLAKIGFDTFENEHSKVATVIQLS